MSIEMKVKCGESGGIEFYTKKRINFVNGEFDISCVEYDEEAEKWVKVKSVGSQEEATEWASAVNVDSEPKYRMPRVMEMQKINQAIMQWVGGCLVNPDGLKLEVFESQEWKPEDFNFTISMCEAAAASIQIAVEKMKGFRDHLANAEEQK